MIDRVILDLCAVLLAPELQVRLLASQLDKDGLLVCCYADLPRDTIRRALKSKQYLQLFDILLYPETLCKMDSYELRLLQPPAALWLRTPDVVDYKVVLPYLSPRRRLLPRALRLRIDDDTIFEGNTDSSE